MELEYGYYIFAKGSDEEMIIWLYSNDSNKYVLGNTIEHFDSSLYIGLFRKSNDSDVLKYYTVDGHNFTDEEGHRLINQMKNDMKIMEYEVEKLDDSKINKYEDSNKLTTIEVEL